MEYSDKPLKGKYNVQFIMRDHNFKQRYHHVELNMMHDFTMGSILATMGGMGYSGDAFSVTNGSNSGEMGKLALCPIK